MDKQQKRQLSCHSCQTEVECSSSEPPCEVLRGWFTVTQWEGPGAVTHHYFCSFGCLKSWISTQRPEVPEIFLKSFGEEESRENPK